jgi:hypothetical protein
MLKGKNLWVVLGLGAAAYYIYWMKMKKDKTNKASGSMNFTGDLDVVEYQNAGGIRVPQAKKFTTSYDATLNPYTNPISGGFIRFR